MIIILFIILFIILLIILRYIFTYQREFFTVNNTIFNKCYVINLSETNEGRRRWEIIKKHPILNSFINRYQGIYGKSYDFSNLIRGNVLAEYWDYGSWHNGNGNSKKMIKMDKGELGCILSHRNLWQKIVEEKIPVSLVLEDDAINVNKNFITIVSTLKKHLPDDWDILLLGFWLHSGDNGYPINKYIHRVGNFALTHSYLIRLKGAQTLLKLGVIDKPLDTWLSSISGKLKIYRHNFIRKGTPYPSSNLIRQIRTEKQINNTNNW